MSDQVRALTHHGSDRFRTYIESLRDQPGLTPPFGLLTDPSSSEAVDFAASIEQLPEGLPFENRYQFGSYLTNVLEAADRQVISQNAGLWNWLALYYFDQLCPATDGHRQPRETAVYVLPERYQYNRYYRHLVRGPWVTFAVHATTSEVLLIPVSTRGSALTTTGEIFEQVAGRQGVFRSATVVAAIHAMYFDKETGRPKRGTGGGAGGSPRRLGAILKQFERTFDLEWGDERLVLDLLPREFDAWKKHLQSNGGG